MDPAAATLEVVKALAQINATLKGILQELQTANQLASRGAPR
jgi:hypothetical protein